MADLEDDDGASRSKVWQRRTEKSTALSKVILFYFNLSLSVESLFVYLYWQIRFVSLSDCLWQQVRSPRKIWDWVTPKVCLSLRFSFVCCNIMIWKLLIIDRERGQRRLWLRAWLKRQVWRKTVTPELCGVETAAATNVRGRQWPRGGSVEDTVV